MKRCYRQSRKESAKNLQFVAYHGKFKRFAKYCDTTKVPLCTIARVGYITSLAIFSIVELDFKTFIYYNTLYTVLYTFRTNKIYQAQISFNNVFFVILYIF